MQKTTEMKGCQNMQKLLSYVTSLMCTFIWNFYWSSQFRETVTDDAQCLLLKIMEENDLYWIYL